MRHLLALLMLVLTLAPALAQDQEERDRDFLTRIIEDNLSGDTRIVRLDGFRGALSSEAHFDRLTIADEDGVWLTIEDAVLDWSRAALLRGRLEVEELTAGRIALERLPPGEGEGGVALPRLTARDIRLPELPVAVNIGRIGADVLELGPGVLGSPVTARFQGAMTLEDGAGTARLELVRTDGVEGSAVIAVALDNGTRLLDLDIGVHEAADGVVANLLDVPGRPSLDLSLVGAGPLSDYLADLTLATDGEERLSGAITLQDLPTDAQGFSVALEGDVRPLFRPDYRTFFGDSTSLTVAGNTPAEGGTEITELSVSSGELSLDGNLSLAPDGLPRAFTLTGAVRPLRAEGALLPLAGPETHIGAATIDARFDSGVGETFSVTASFNALRRGTTRLATGTLNASGRITRAGVGGNDNITAAVTAALAGIDLGDRAMEAALTDRVSAEVDLDWTRGVALRLTSARIAAGETELTGAATLQGLGEMFRITGGGELTAPDLSNFAGLYGQSLSGAARAKLDGSYAPLGGAFDLTLDAATTGLAAGTGLVGRLAGGDSSFKGRLARTTEGITAEGLQIVTPQLSATLDGGLTPQAGRLSFDGSLNDLALVAAPLQGPATITGTLDRQEDTLVLDLRAEGAQGLTASITGSSAADASAFDIDFDAAMTDLGAVVPAFPGPAQAQGSLARGPDGFALTADASLPPGLTARLDGTASNDLATAGFDVDIRLADASEITPLLTGPITATGQIGKDGDQVTFDLDTTARPGITAALEGTTSLSLADLRAEVSAGIEDLSAFVPKAEGPAAASGTIARQGERFLVDLRGIALERVTFALRGSLAADASEADLRLTGQGPIETAAPWLGEIEATGTAAADLRLQGPPSLASLSGNLTARDARIGLPNGISASGLSATVTLDPTLAPSAFLAATAQLEAQDISAPGQPWAPLLRTPLAASATVILPDTDTLRLEGLTAADQGASFAGDVLVASLSDAPVVTADGTATVALARLAPLIGLTLGGSASAEIDATYATADGALTLSTTGTTQGVTGGGNPALDLLAGDGRFAADLTSGPEGLRVSQAALTTAALDVTATGRDDGSFDVNARLDSLGRLVPQLPGPVTASGLVAPAPGGVRLDITAQGPGGIGLSAAGTVGGDSSLAITGTAPLGVANAFISNAIDVQGSAAIDLRLAGAPSLANLSGTVSTSNGSAVLPAAGVALTGIAARANLSGGSAALSATANVRDGGSVSVEGTAGLSAPFALDLGIGLNGVRYVQAPTLRTSLDGRLTLTGAVLSGGALQGAITLGETDINLAIGAAGGSVSEVAHVGDSAAVRETRRRAGLNGPGSGPGVVGGSAQIALDVLISAPNRIFVRGRGLDAELGGELRITGDTSNVVPIGAFELIRGRLDILGRRLDLTEGQVLLQGTMDPTVRLVAATTAEDVAVQIVTEGTASAPEITLTSSPGMPEDEILALLLFGRGLDSISALQALQLANAIRTLMGDGGEGILGRLRSGFGLDDFDVTSDADGNFAVRAGKYISDNAYADVVVNSEGETEIELNIDITPSLTARGSVGTDGETGLGLFFEKDY